MRYFQVYEMFLIYVADVLLFIPQLSANLELSKATILTLFSRIHSVFSLIEDMEVVLEYKARINCLGINKKLFL